MSRTSRVCPVCGEPNLPWAQHCKDCSASLEGVALATSPRELRIPRSFVTGMLLCALAFSLLLLIGRTALDGSGAGAAPLLRVTWHKFYGANRQEIIVGEVRNQSPNPINHVLVVGEFYSEDGQELEAASDPLETQPLAPGATSHFRVAAPYLPGVQRSWFHFQTTDGQMVRFNREGT